LHIKNTHTNTNPQKKADAACVLDARNHYPQIKHHTPPPKMEQQQSDTTDVEPPGKPGTGLLSQSPTVCLAAPDNPHKERSPS
jgi:hypothetical protein